MSIKMVVEKLKEREDARDNKRDEEHDPRLYELKVWSFVKMEDWIYEFLWVDWMYWRWKNKDWGIIIMWHANQHVSEYWEIL